MSALRPVTDDIWVVKAPFSLPGGIELGVTMTVVRMPSGRLCLHSPLPVDDALAKELATLGEVEHLVAPNRFHHLYMAGAKERYSGASTWGSAALQQKLGASFDHTLAPDGAFEGMRVLHVGGAPALDEYVFYHEASTTLITADLFFNIPSPANLRTAAVLRLMGDYPGLRQGLLLKIFARNRAAWRASMGAVFELPFENLIMSHGEPVVGGAREKARATCGWGLPKVGA